MKQASSKAVLFLLLGFLSVPLQSLAGQLNLSNAPAGAAREPAPNVIVSVDDSGSMGVEGIATLKAALTATFSATNIVDGKIRLAWQSMNRCRSIPNNGTACSNLNGMKSLEGDHRTNFMAWANTLYADGPTPSHLMIDNAGKYLSRTDLGINSPWAADPGTKEAPVHSCRKNFHIFMTDGVWNSTDKFVKDIVDGSGEDRVRIVRGGNADNTTIELPKAKVTDTAISYSNTSPQTRLYRDDWGSNTLSTFSDLAFYYWSTDLQPSMTNNVATTMAVTETATIGGVAVEPFWNPRNDPAVWQHMVTYTIGFDPDGPGGPKVPAGAWNGAPVWGGNTFAGDLPSLISGSVTWPTPLCGANNVGTGNQPCDGVGNSWAAGDNPIADARRMELWHAALNSRGEFVPAPDADALKQAFKTILDKIINPPGQSLVSIAAGSSRLRSDSTVFVAGYKNKDGNWSGELAAYPISAATGSISTTPTWTVSSFLDSTSTTVFSATTRLVLTHDGTSGRSFEWANLSTEQQNLIKGVDDATVGSSRVSYVRGDTSFEMRNGGTMRNRNSRLGDIVNSNLWLMGPPSRLPYEHYKHKEFRAAKSSRTPIIFVGANDGMLHAFDATTGKEKLAYVPKAAYSGLRNYTLPQYSHQYYVDGSPFTGDVDTSRRLNSTSTVAAWKTVLVSGMGAGGRGYFILDVTDPATWSSPGSGTSSFVILDKTVPSSSTGSATVGDEINDLGHIFSTPVTDAVSGKTSEQIVKLNDGRWAVIMGNGLNSVNERPVLLIQYLDGNKALKRLVASATVGTGNGLAAPRLIDANDDGRVDLVYAGDHLGNLWKFDLSSQTASAWKVSFSGSPLFVAQDGASNTQPITSAPMWVSHPNGGVQVLFGTGVNVTDSHQSNTSTQTIYSVWDKSSITKAGTSTVAVADLDRITTGRSALVEQTVSSAVTQTLADSSVVDSDYFNTTANDVTYTGVNAKRGWYFDLPAQGERVLVNPAVWEGQKILISSQVPSIGNTGETCDVNLLAADNWINVLNMLTGKPATTPVFSVTGGNMDLKNATRTRFGSGDFIWVKGSDSTTLISPTNDGYDKEKLNHSKGLGARSEWREIQF